MPYPKNHKIRTRQRILESAHRLFSNHGFEATSIEEIMLECDLTRGGFYSHFRSKAQLYQEAMGNAAQQSGSPESRGGKNDSFCIDAILASCLHPSGAAAHGGQGWSFLAADVASKQPEVRAAYAQAFRALSQRLQNETAPCPDNDNSSLAAMTMVVGALAVAMTVDDIQLRETLINACREHAGHLLEAGGKEEPFNFFWAAEGPEGGHALPLNRIVH